MFSYVPYVVRDVLGTVMQVLCPYCLATCHPKNAVTQNSVLFTRIPQVETMNKARSQQTTTECAVCTPGVLGYRSIVLPLKCQNLRFYETSQLQYPAAWRVIKARPCQRMRLLVIIFRLAVKMKSIPFPLYSRSAQRLAEE